MKKCRSGEELALRQCSDPRVEHRYEPKVSTASKLGTLALWLGAGLAGAGFYGEFLRGADKGPHALAAYLLGAGSALALGAVLMGPKPPRPIRVGDAGVAVEKDAGEVERIGWNEVSAVRLTHALLAFQGSGTSISIPVVEHRDAAVRALAEARARIPSFLEGLETEGLDGPVDDSVGQPLELEAPQVAGLHCKASGQLISFEKDARLCGYCGEVYHKDDVPLRCATCQAKLRS